MFVIVTIPFNVSSPLVNGANEVKSTYLAMYGYDYTRSCCTPNDFNFKKAELITYIKNKIRLAHHHSPLALLPPPDGGASPTPRNAPSSFNSH